MVKRLAVLGTALVLVACGETGMAPAPTPDIDATVTARVNEAGATAMAGITPGPGPQGSQGLTGERGPLGLSGLSGLRGPIGPQGETGPIGPIGPRGLIGFPGSEGPRGVAGPPGVQGPAGPVDRSLQVDVSRLRADLDTLRKDVECEVRGTDGPHLACTSPFGTFFRGETVAKQLKDIRESFVENDSPWFPYAPNYRFDTIDLNQLKCWITYLDGVTSGRVKPTFHLCREMVTSGTLG